MLKELRLTRYVVEFFHSSAQGGVPNDKVYLTADTVSDAVSQANWLARRTYHHHFQVRIVADGAHTIVYISPPLAMAA
jgi:hypothetical protein